MKPYPNAKPQVLATTWSPSHRLDALTMAGAQSWRRNGLVAKSLAHRSRE